MEFQMFYSVVSPMVIVLMTSFVNAQVPQVSAQTTACPNYPHLEKDWIDFGEFCYVQRAKGTPGGSADFSCGVIHIDQAFKNTLIRLGSYSFTRTTSGSIATAFYDYQQPDISDSVVDSVDNATNVETVDVIVAEIVDSGYVMIRCQTKNEDMTATVCSLPYAVMICTYSPTASNGDINNLVTLASQNGVDTYNLATVSCS